MSKKNADINLLITFFFKYQGIKTNGQNIVDENNNIVQLRGIGLSGWMLQNVTCLMLVQMVLQLKTTSRKT